MLIFWLTLLNSPLAKTTLLHYPGFTKGYSGIGSPPILPCFAMRSHSTGLQHGWNDAQAVEDIEREVMLALQEGVRLGVGESPATEGFARGTDTKDVPKKGTYSTSARTSQVLDICNCNAQQLC